MALLRHQPGEIAPWTGTYVLVGHYGEATDLAPVWCNAGDRLPYFTGVADSGPFWFVQVHEANEQSRVA